MNLSSPTLPRASQEAPADSYIFPASYVQRRLWFLHQLEPESPTYNVPLYLRLRGPLQAETLERSLSELVRRHEILRTTFPVRDGEPVQQIHPPRPVDWTLVDLAAILPAAAAPASTEPASAESAGAERDDMERRDMERAAIRLRHETLGRPFDLDAGPLFRACLVRRDAEDHELLLTMHHIVSDGWSKQVLTRELGQLYAAFRDGASSSPLPEPEIQYADYSVWQRERLQGAILDQQLEYWTRRLADVPAIDLPTDFARSHGASRAGAVITFTLPEPLIEHLQSLSRREGATLFMVLLAGFQWLLGRYVGQQDVSVGTAIANRRHPGTEGLIGCLVNTLVMRADLGGAPSFRELIARVRQLALEAYTHQDLPFERLVEALNPQRALGRTPLFQVMFSVESGQPDALRISGLSVEPIEGGDLERAKFDLMLLLAPSARGYQGELQYAADLYRPETIERLALHYERLLAAAAAQPDRPLPSLALADAHDAQQAAEWNRTESLSPIDTALDDLFAQQAARQPQAIAIEQAGRAISYAELDARSARLAALLRGRGVGPEDRVGICLERGIELIAWLVAIVKAGAAYVPLDPSYPADRLAYMVRDARTALIVTEQRFRASLGLDAPVLCLDDRANAFERSDAAVSSYSSTGAHADVGTSADTGAIANADAIEKADATADAGRQPRPAARDGERLAYVMYTSGSTGQPKGIAVPHRGIVRLVLDTNYVRITASDRLAQLSNASFDAATFEIWGALLNGAAIVLLDQETALNPIALADTLRRERVTIAFLTTALFNQTVREARRAFEGMRTVMFGGEAVEPRWVRQLLADGGPERLLNVYGPTETTTFATWHVVRDVAPRQQTIPIGRPIARTQAYILDEQFQLVPPGMPGEICIGGAGVARGYWQRPALTAERFVPDPFGGVPGGRLYRTGDRARIGANGDIEFIGRFDDQVKLRGHRIELREVDSVLAQHPGVQHAVTVLRDEADDRQLVAYLVPADDVPLEAAQIRQALRQRLPDYMVPSAFVILPALPLTVNGKLDRRALPAPARDDRAHQAYVAPATEIEELLCRIWMETLRVDRVGAADNFFELGGHSLLATRVMSRLRADLGIELPLRTLFEQPTVAALAVTLAARLGQEAPVPPLAPAGRDEPLPLSSAQRRLWFLQQLDPGSGAYNVPFFLTLDGPLDVAALDASLTDIVRRHEVLRTGCPARRGEPYQDIRPPFAVHVPVIDLSRLAAGVREAAAAALRQQAADGPFDLGEAPLWRVQLLRLAPARHELLLTMHHVVTDGWSEAVIIAELKALYEAHRDGSRAPLPEIAIQYADFAAWQQQALAAGAMAGQVDYWRRQLEAVPVLELPADHPRTQGTRHPQASRAIRLSAVTAGAVQRLATRERATPFMVLLAALQWVLSRYARQSDVAVGSVVANRTRAEIEPLIGFFVNTLVFRTDVSGHATFRQLLQTVRAAALDAYAHQEVPFERLVEELNPDRDLGRTPFFQVMLTVQNIPAGAWELAGMQVGEIDVELRDAKFELHLTLRDTGDGIDGRVSYAADLFHAETIDQLLTHYARFVEAALADPDGALAAIPLLSPAEREAILASFTRTAQPQPQPAAHVGSFAGAGAAAGIGVGVDGGSGVDVDTVMDLIEARARQHPDRIALISDGRPLTYGDLCARANRCAHALLARGLMPETRVAVYLERGLEWAAAVLGIWKAGGAYVPLDPAYPRERHAFVLDEARAAIVLTDQAMRDDLPQHPAVICLDLEWEAIEQQSAEPPSVEVMPARLAYVMYTSGSTGAPKGVAIEHRGMLNHLQAKIEDLALADDDVVAQNAPASFDISVWQLFAPLLAGGRVQILGDEISRDAYGMLAEVAESGITVLETVPSLFAAMIDREESRGAMREALPRLRCVISNAEALPIGLCDRWLALYPHVRLLNTYGATECSDDVTHQTMQAAARGPSGLAPLGTPLLNSSVYVLDAQMEPVPHGVAGELYLGGAGVGRGYLAQPMLTAGRFVPDPFGGRPGARLYRTGDLGRARRDGTLEFIGRIDLQVKVRGHRVELGEIESTLLKHDAVSQAVVLLREDAPGDQRLAAYAVPPAGTAADGALTSQVRAWLAERLPDYMVPSALVWLDAMPLTVNGKVDRRALPAPDGADRADTYVAPRNELETMLCGLWAQLLRLDRIGIHDNFFALGGHSLLATQVIARVRAALDVNVPLAAIFRSPTVSGFAAELTRARDAGQIPAIGAADRSAFRAKRQPS